MGEFRTEPETGVGDRVSFDLLGSQLSVTDRAEQ